MPSPMRFAVTVPALAAALLLALVSTSHAQRSGAGSCRQGLLALMVMIDADEHDRSLYRNTAKDVVETCGPPAAAKPTAAAPSTPFDKEQCGKLALAMLDSIEDNKLDRPQFAQAREKFAAKCIGR